MDKRSQSRRTEASRASQRRGGQWARPALATAMALVAFVGLTYLIRLVLASSHHAAARSSQFGLWAALIAVSAVTYAFLFARTLHLTRGWRRLSGVRVLWPLIIYGVGVNAVLAYVWERGRSVDALPPSTVAPVAKAIVVLGAVAAAPAVIGLWRVQCRLRRIGDLLGERTTELRRADDVLADLIECRKDKSVCLAVLAVLVTTAVINTGAVRRAYLATGTRPELFPPEWVLLYGALFTLVLLLLYVPVFVTWRSRCLEFTDEIYPLPADARPTDEWVNGRTRLVQLLGADTSISKNLTAAFGILVPLAISVLSVVIPGLK